MVMIFLCRLVLFLLFSTSIISTDAFLPFNSSNLSSSTVESLPPSSSLLKEVLKAIAAKERWDPRYEVRVSEVDVRNARVASSERHEFHIRVSKSVLVFKFSDEIVSWRKLSKEVEFGPDLTLCGGAVGSRSVLRAFELEGPLILHVSGGDDELSLFLPALNITHQGLRRVLVRDGITIKVEGAQEVSLVHPSSFGLPLNERLATHNKDKFQFWPLGYSICTPLPSLHVLGSASLFAFRTHNPKACIETAFHSHDTVELLPEKCYRDGSSKWNLSRSFPSLSSRLALLEKVLGSSLGDRIFHNRSSYLLKAKITPSTLVKFWLELERDIGENDRIWKKVAEWKTKPTVERLRFEIVARVEGETGLKPVVVKKLKKPLIVVDSAAWSNLMSNISFTQFPSIVVPPEALTLDVKW